MESGKKVAYALFSPSSGHAEHCICSLIADAEGTTKAALTRACQSIATLIFSRAQGIDLQGVQMEIEGDLDPDGFMGLDPNVRNGLQEIRFKVHLKCDDEEKARALARLAEERCPVGDCLKNPVPVVCTDVAVG